MCSSFSSLPQGNALRLCALSLAAAAAVPALAQSRLPTVTVTATRFAEPAASLPFGVSVLDAQDIRRSGAATVNEALMKLLGVVGRLDTSGGNNYSLDLRGFGSTAGSNQVVIVDGLRLNEADLTSAGLSSIPIDTVETIEVLRGTGAVLYGEGATGGVIVITTKAGIGSQRVNAAQLYLAGGSLGLRESRATATLAAGGFSVDVAASDRNSDGHRDNFASATDAFSASAQWSNDWLRLGLRGGRDAFRSGSPGALSAAQYDTDPSQAISLTEYGAAQKDHAGIFAEAHLGAWQLMADANRRSKDYDSLAFGTPFAYAVRATNTSVRARHEGSLASLPHVFVVGHDDTRWERTIVASLFTPAGTQARARSSAWYVKSDLTMPSSGTRLSLGFRDEGLDKSEDQSASSLDQREHAWEIGLSQPLGAGVTAYLRTGRSFRLANVDEFSFTNPAVALQPQTSRDTELGARWRAGASALELRWYRSALRNEIGYDPAGNGPFGPFGANVNFDPTRRQGLELEASHAIGAALDLRLNVALRQARFTSGPYQGNDVMLVPKRTVALRADWRPASGHAISGGVTWVSSQSPDFANQCTIPSYATADLRYAYSWGRAELALGVANLADKKYFTQAFGCTAAGVTTAIYPEAGRTITASVLYRF
jgi:iron complex outermembrane receptor protein